VVVEDDVVPRGRRRSSSVVFHGEHPAGRAASRGAARPAAERTLVTNASEEREESRKSSFGGTHPR
jgi:hypothetical protein